MSTLLEAPKWLVEGPIDEEYKTYRMMSEIEHIRQLLKEGDMEKALDLCEAALDYLYVYDAIQMPSPVRLFLPPHPEDELIEELESYTHPPKNEVDQELMASLVNLGIESYEDVHREIRNRWREIEESLTLSYVHNKPTIVKTGYVFVALGKVCVIFRFTKPNTRVKDWVDFHMTDVTKIKNSPSDIGEWIESLEEDISLTAFIKVNAALHTKMINELYTVLRSIIFFKVKKDYGLSS